MFNSCRRSSVPDEIRPRHVLKGLTIALFVASSSLSAVAAQPSGTVTCAIASSEPVAFEKVGFVFRPFLSNDPTRIASRASNGESSCDSSGVIGSSLPIDEVRMKLSGRLLDATCSSFFSTSPTIVHGKILLQWRGTNPAGGSMTVGVSKATTSSASYDSGSGVLTIVTDAIAGAFAGEVATVQLGFDGDLSFYAAVCDNEAASIRYIEFGHTNTSTISVQ
jgi:hypothetical protein